MYLITYADTAPANADYDADRIEHILGGDLVRDLELRLQQQEEQGLPASPHQIASPPSSGKI
jgi:manganese/zinc/iron transport system permease protein